MTKTSSIKDKKWSWPHHNQEKIAAGFDRILLYDFNLLEEHREFAAASFSSEAKKLKSRYKDMIKGVSAEDRDAYFCHMADAYQDIIENLPRLQWFAQFLMVYSTFEHMLHELCRIVQRRSNFNLSFKDLEGLGITRARNYLVKVARVESPFQTPAWQRANLLNEIRNAIAHRNGEIEFQQNNPKHLSARLKKEKDLTLKQLVADHEFAQIGLNGEFVRQAITDLRIVIVDISNYKLYPNNN